MDFLGLGFGDVKRMNKRQVDIDLNDDIGLLNKHTHLMFFVLCLHLWCPIYVCAGLQLGPYGILMVPNWTNLHPLIFF